MNYSLRNHNNSFDDLSFINNIDLTTKLIFVFDFDLTLTIKSSDGLIYKNINSYIDLFDSQIKINKLIDKFNQIKLKNHLIYLNTRGLVYDIKNILNNIGINVGVNKLIKDIKGSNNIETINKPFTELYLRTHNLEEIKNIKILWGIKKVVFLNEIVELEKINKNNILFFDDSVTNINISKLNGYDNSFIIGSNDSGFIGLDYLLIKLEQILMLL
jgi:hypothetical protein